MIPAAQLVETFKSNHWLANRLLKDMTPTESLIAPAVGINSLNWVLGHIIVGRNEALSYLMEPGLWSDEMESRYKTGSEMLESAKARPLADLIADLDKSQANLEAGLASVEEQFLREIVDTRFGERPRWAHLSGLAWHETYHIGQFELLQQFARNRRK